MSVKWREDSIYLIQRRGREIVTMRAENSKEWRGVDEMI